MNSEKTPRGDVLVIEDNMSFVHALRAVVSRRIFAVTRLEDGMRAIRGHRWTRIVLDLDLPDSDLAQTIRIFPAIKAAAAETPIVVLTGFPGAAENLLELGASAVIGKGDERFADKLIAAL